MVRANTIEIQGKPGLMGDVGGIYLAIATSEVPMWAVHVPVDLLCRSRYWRMEIKAPIREQRGGCLQV
jgi:hypothetical protein